MGYFAQIHEITRRLSDRLHLLMSPTLNIRKSAQLQPKEYQFSVQNFQQGIFFIGISNVNFNEDVTYYNSVSYKIKKISHKLTIRLGPQYLQQQYKIFKRRLCASLVYFVHEGQDLKKSMDRRISFRILLQGSEYISH